MPDCSTSFDDARTPSKSNASQRSQASVLSRMPSHGAFSFFDQILQHREWLGHQRHPRVAPPETLILGIQPEWLERPHAGIRLQDRFPL
jgi:hypothetical protein